MCPSAFLENAVLFSRVDVSVDVSTSGMFIENGKFWAFFNTVGMKSILCF